MRSNARDKCGSGYLQLNIIQTPLKSSAHAFLDLFSSVPLPLSREQQSLQTVNWQVLRPSKYIGNIRFWYRVSGVRYTNFILSLSSHRISPRPFYSESKRKYFVSWICDACTTTPFFYTSRRRWERLLQVRKSFWIGFSRRLCALRKSTTPRVQRRKGIQEHHHRKKKVSFFPNFNLFPQTHHFTIRMNGRLPKYSHLNSMTVEIHRIRIWLSDSRSFFSSSASLRDNTARWCITYRPIIENK